MHELSHFYIRELVPIEVYNVNECLNLDAKESAVNAASFAYYAASESFIQVSSYFESSGFFSDVAAADVRSKCNSFPKPSGRGSGRPFGIGTNLLEVFQNETMINDTMSIINKRRH